MVGQGDLRPVQLSRRDQQDHPRLQRIALAGGDVVDPLRKRAVQFIEVMAVGGHGGKLRVHPMEDLIAVPVHFLPGFKGGNVSPFHNITSPWNIAIIIIGNDVFCNIVKC